MSNDRCPICGGKGGDHGQLASTGQWCPRAERPGRDSSRPSASRTASGGLSGLPGTPLVDPEAYSGLQGVTEGADPVMAEPTEADRERAHRIWNEALCNSGIPGWDRNAELAQALADERERALQRFTGLADELAAVADCIRRAAEETGQ